MAPTNLHTTHTQETFNWVWDVASSEWVKMTQPSGGGGGGGAVTIADGADVAQGTTTDAAVVTDSNGTVIGFLRGLVKIFSNVWDSVAGRLKVETTYNATATGSVTNPGDTFTLGVTGFGTATGVLTTGPDGQSFYIEATNDGSNWVSLTIERSPGLAASALDPIRVDGFMNTDLAGSTPYFRANITGFTTIRVRKAGGTNLSTWVLAASPEPYVSLYGGSKLIGKAGYAANVSSTTGSLLVEDGSFQAKGVSDGANGNAAIKAPSTPAAAADRALVVAISPNNTIPISGAVTVSGTATETYATASSTATWSSATALNTAITISTIGLSTAILSLRKAGTPITGLITFEYSLDGSVFNSVSAGQARQFLGLAFANPFDFTTGSSPTAVQVDVAGMQSIRMRLSTAIVGGGTVDVRVDGSAAQDSLPVGTSSISGTVQQGNTATSNSQGWWTRIGDATNGPAAVKASTTAPTTSDAALVVAVSPNSPPTAAVTAATDLLLLTAGSASALTQTPDGRLRVDFNAQTLLNAINDLTEEVRQLRFDYRLTHGL